LTAVDDASAINHPKEKRMKNSLLLLVCVLFAYASNEAMAQQASQITIVSDPSSWYVETNQGYAPSAEALIAHPDITTLPGPIPEHWSVTRLDPWTQARVIWTQNGWVVATWSSSRILPNWHEYRTPFHEMSRGKSFYTRKDLPMGHAMLAEFHLADRNGDNRISPREHQSYFEVR
jgi:hypothetical protein